MKMQTTLSAIPGLSKLDLLILGLLCGRPMHGYELNQILGSKEMSWVDISRSSTYKALDRAKKQGLVAEVVEEQTDKPLKSVFYVTNKGREAFFENLRRLWLQPPKVSFEEHIGVFFLNLLPEGEAAGLLEARLGSLQAWAAAHPDIPLRHPDKVINFSTLAYIRERLDEFVAGEIKWYEELVAALRERPAKKAGNKIPAFTGSLKDFELVNVIKLLVDGRRTGTLYLTRNLSVNSLHFKEGHIMGVAKRAAEAEGLAAESQSELPAIGKKKDKASSVLEEIYAAFSVSDGRFSFESSVRDDYLPVQLTTLEFLREGCRQINDWETIRSLVPSPGIVFDWAIDRSSSIVTLNVADEDKNVLAQVNGMKSVQDIATLAGLSLFRTSKVLYVYGQLGAVVAVSADRRELLEVLRSVVKLLLEGTGPILTKRESSQLAGQITQSMQEQNLPFAIENGQMIDKIDEPVDIIKLEDMTKTFLNELVDSLKAKIGEAAVDDLLSSSYEQLGREAREVIARYGVILEASR